ncbi:hypothetical protein D3C84_1188230 [compost metagenome]
MADIAGVDGVVEGFIEVGVECQISVLGLGGVVILDPTRGFQVQRVNGHPSMFGFQAHLVGVEPGAR